MKPEDVRVGDHWDHFGETFVVKKINKRRANARTGAPAAITGFVAVSVYKDAFGKMKEGRFVEFAPRELDTLRPLKRGS